MLVLVLVPIKHPGVQACVSGPALPSAGWAPGPASIAGQTDCRIFQIPRDSVAGLTPRHGTRACTHTGVTPQPFSHGSRDVGTVTALPR